LEALDQYNEFTRGAFRNESFKLKSKLLIHQKGLLLIFNKKLNNMSNLLRIYIKISSLLHELEPTNHFLNQVRLPKLNDKQLIALSLAAEALGIDSERYLFIQLPRELKPLIERSVYNRTRHSLAFKIEEFRQKIADQITASSQHGCNTGTYMDTSP